MVTQLCFKADGSQGKFAQLSDDGNKLGSLGRHLTRPEIGRRAA